MSIKPQLNIQDMSCKHDGRVIRLEVFVNSNEDINEVLARVQKASRGQLRNAVVVMASQYTGEDGKKVWSALQKVSADAAANPKSVSVDENLKPL